MSLEPQNYNQQMITTIGNQNQGSSVGLYELRPSTAYVATFSKGDILGEKRISTLNGTGDFKPEMIEETEYGMDFEQIEPNA